MAETSSTPPLALLVAPLAALGAAAACWHWGSDGGGQPQQQRPLRKPRVALVHGGCSNPVRATLFLCGCYTVAAHTIASCALTRCATRHPRTRAQAIFRRQLKKLLARLGDSVELVDLEGGLLSAEVRFDERGVKNMALLHKIFGDHQVLREHAVTTYDDSPASLERYPPHGTFLYDRLEEGLAHLEGQLETLRCDGGGPVDALIGFSQGANMATMLAARQQQRQQGQQQGQQQRQQGQQQDQQQGQQQGQQQFKALVLLENDPPGWPQQPEMQTVFGEQTHPPSCRAS